MTSPTLLRKAPLAKKLGIHRATLDDFLKSPGAPTPDARRAYNVHDVAAFIAAARGTNPLDTLRAAKLEEVRLRCEKLRRDLDRESRKLIPREEIEALHGKMATALRAALYSALENQLPAKIAGCDALTCREHGRAIADDLVSRFARDVENWNATT